MTEAATIATKTQAAELEKQFQGLFTVIPFRVNVDEDSIADQAASAGNITVTGAALGDFVLITPRVDSGDLLITATVTAANTVTVVFGNLTAGAVTSLAANPSFNGLVLKPDQAIFDELV